MKQLLRLSTAAFFSLVGPAAVLAQAPGPAALSSGLVTWLQLDEDSGLRAIDVSGSGRSAQLVNGAVWHPWGKNGRCLNLNNAAAALQVPLKWQPTAFTISWWVYVDPGKVGNYTQAVGASLNSGDAWSGFLFHASSTGRVFAGTDGATRLESGDNVMLTAVWQQFTFTFDQGEAALYKNGVKLAGRSGMTMPAMWQGLAIGSTTTTSLPANGYFDDLRVYDRALTPGEVSQLVGTTAAVYTPPAAPTDDLDRNWSYSRSFDGSGNVIGEGKSFTDGLGRSTQTQVKSQTTGHVLATQAVYSTGGKPVLSTLAAPTNNREFSYKDNFLTNGGTNYRAANFEDANANAPLAADQPTTPGSVGYYYSSQNTLEPLTATTSYPFSLTDEYSGPLGGVKRATGPGDAFRMGLGREAKGREFTLLNELDHYLSLRPQFVPGSPAVATLRAKGEKAVSINVDGRESVSFSDADGKMLATCLTGPQYAGLTLTLAVHSDPNNADGLPRYQDIHVPTAGPVVLSVQGTGAIRVVDLLTEVVSSYAAPWPAISLAPGFYRVISDRDNQALSYLARYGDFSYSYYDDAGRVVATVAPQGVAAVTGPAAISTTGRAGQWSFNEASGTAAGDASGNGLAGTLVNAPTWSTAAAPVGIPASPAGGSCLLFNGTNSYVRVGDPAALRFSNTLSFEAWIYPTAAQDGILINKENEYEVQRFADGSIQWAFRNTSPGWAWGNTGIVAPLNTWSHIGITYENGVVKAYLNGVQVGSPYNGSGPIQYQGGEFWIGARQAGGQLFKGALDEVRVWNTVHAPTTGAVGPIQFVTRNTYSGAGTLLATESTDEGRTEYVYARDGRIRFSQSALQKQQNRFSYSNYDEVGRVVESGEYQMGGASSAAFETQQLYSTVMEAEAAQTNAVVTGSLSNASGGGLEYLAAVGRYVSFAVTVPRAGQYTLGFQYSSGMTGAARTMGLYVNGVRIQQPTFPLTGSWNTWAMQSAMATLQAGANTVMLRMDASDTGWINLDYVQVGEQQRAPVANSVVNLLEERMPTNSLNTAYCSQRNQVWYDLGTQDVPYPAYARTQEFVLGAVAKTSNGANTTWYSYDELGRVTWLVQSVPGVGTKTVDYSYDFTGNVLEVAYQKGQTDAFYHQYEYDADRRLRSVYTSTDGLAASRTLQARYFYYLHGPLKRVEVANRLQGIDYAYTVQGWLKSINNSQKELDPGQDTPSGNGVLKDLFGMRLDYFDGDYASRQLTAPNVYISPNNGEMRYDGTVRANSWFTPNVATVNANAYRYDAKGQLLESIYGQYFGGNYFNYSTNGPYYEGNLSYDAHGNILSLRRTDNTSIAGDNFAYNYTANTNKLLAVRNPAGADVLNYEYDVNGQMTREAEVGKGDKFLQYDVTGKVTGVFRNRDLTGSIAQYAYDDRGFRSSKIVYNTAGVAQNTTYYVTDAQGNVLSTYEQPAGQALNRTEVPIYGSGRVGTLTRVDDGTMDARYELNDQLGNARVIFHRPKTNTWLATMEPSQASTEEQNFQNLPTTRWADGRAYDGSNVARLNGAMDGPKKTLTVEKGDTITFTAQALWLDQTMALAAASSSAPALRVAPLITAAPLVPAVGRASSTDGHRSSGLLSRLTFGISLTGFGGGKKSPVPMAALTGTTPSVLIRYRYYDVNNVLKAEVTKPMTVGASTWESLQLGYRAPDAGRVELTVLNASTYTAFFDHVEVKQTGSTIVQEQHTYAFGSPLTGLNYVVGNRRYRHGYQGQFAEKDEETGYDSFELRLYNSRIGRWTSFDPEGQFDSPYVGMGNNPVSGIDPDGGWGLNGTGWATGGTRWVGQASRVAATAGKYAAQAGMSIARAQGIGSAGPKQDRLRELRLNQRQNGSLDYIPKIADSALLKFGYKPDKDGLLNLDEANYWYRNGQGVAMEVDASKLDLSFISVTDFDGAKVKTFQTVYNPTFEGRVYGQITIELIDKHKGIVKIRGDRYDFEMHDSSGKGLFNSTKVSVRNGLTGLGRMIAGRGMPFPINFKNFGKISVK